ncbi:MAG: DUF4491 family protein [Tenuifilaceae bacterium]|jgi:hypothetical protein|nr:DUF4491 family protein [Tenuifilaceae bacterium]
MGYLLDYIVGFKGFLVGIAAFIVIGTFHPLVIKLEYYFGKRVWWMLLLPGIVFIIISLFLNNTFSILFGVLGAGLLWSTLEIFWQHERALKGQCKRNPKRKYSE